MQNIFFVSLLEDSRKFEYYLHLKELKQIQKLKKRGLILKKIVS